MASSFVQGASTSSGIHSRKTMSSVFDVAGLFKDFSLEKKERVSRLQPLSDECKGVFKKAYKISWLRSFECRSIVDVDKKMEAVGLVSDSNFNEEIASPDQADENADVIRRQMNLIDMCEKGNIKEVKALLENGVDVHCRLCPTPPIYFAFEKGNWELAALLFKYAADPNCKIYIGSLEFSLLDIVTLAAFRSDSPVSEENERQCVEVLVKNGFNLDTVLCVVNRTGIARPGREYPWGEQIRRGFIRDLGAINIIATQMNISVR